MTDHATMVDELLAMARAHCRPELAAWLQDEAWRLIAVGRTEFQRRKARRDYWLREAWNSLPGALTPWQRSIRLASEIRRFTAGSWARTQTAPVVPPEFDAVRRALWHALKTTVKAPRTARHLHSLIAEISVGRKFSGDDRA